MLGFGVAVVLLCLSGVGLGVYVMLEYRSIERVPELEVAAAPPREPENFLVLGSDSRAADALDPDDAVDPTGATGGVVGRRSDTIMVVRVDSGAERLSVLSLPRDLIVTDPLGDRVMINSLYDREGGEQMLVDTLWLNFGIPINHYVEVDFQGFQSVVNAVGGVPMWIPNAVRDRQAGLFLDQLGCVTLDGEAALAFARARHLDYMTPDGWVDDPRSDLSRIDRQQIFIRRAMSEALSQVRDNPLRLRELLDIGVRNVRIDDQLGFRDLMGLADDFRSFGSDRLETYPLPTVPNPVDVNRLLVDAGAAEPMLSIFRGVDPAGAPPEATGVLEGGATSAPLVEPAPTVPDAIVQTDGTGPVVGEPPPGQACH